jgi:3-oxoacyl-[acyl-carrier protein] reductase
MDLQIENQFFVVCGAGSGFGRAIAERLTKEGAGVLAIARSEDALKELQQIYPHKIEILPGDLTNEAFRHTLVERFKLQIPHGILINAGGPPAKSFNETRLSDWDEAYQLLLRWKVDLLQHLLPLMASRHYGRIVMVESVSVKQPVENLVLSNSLRAAVTGMAKTIAGENGAKGITINVMAPGYHDTPAMERLFIKRSQTLGITPQQARISFEKELMTGKMGDASDFARLAAWLLSPSSAYINGQTISVDGGLVKHIFG